MSTLALALPTPRLVSADLLKLRRRTGLVVMTALLTIAAVAVTYAIIELLHVTNPAANGPAGGVRKLGHVSFLLGALGAVAAAVVAATAGAGDLDALVSRDLVVTGRSRTALYLSRIPAGLLFFLPFVGVAYAVAAVASVVFAGSVPEPSTHLLAVTGAWCLLQVTFYYLLAFGLACLLGSRSYAIGVVLALRLALTPIVAGITQLGVTRELVPGIALDHLTPAGLGHSARMGRPVPMSLAATAAVLICWTAVALVAGGRRDATRDG